MPPNRSEMVKSGLQVGCRKRISGKKLAKLCLCPPFIKENAVKSPFQVHILGICYGWDRLTKDVRTRTKRLKLVMKDKKLQKKVFSLSKCKMINCASYYFPFQAPRAHHCLPLGVRSPGRRPGQMRSARQQGAVQVQAQRGNRTFHVSRDQPTS